MADSQSTIDLLEECLPHMEENGLRCSHVEPWCFVTFYAAIMLLKMHLGKETRQAAKSACAQRFLDLHYKHVGRQQRSLLNQQYPTPPDPTNPIDVSVALGLSWEYFELTYMLDDQCRPARCVC